MNERTTLDQWDPFNFRIEGAFGFKRHIEGLIQEERLETALERIELIRGKYLDARDFGKIGTDSFRFSHFNIYRSEQTELTAQGKTFPDGSEDKVIYELNELGRKVQKCRKHAESGKEEEKKDYTDFSQILHCSDFCYKFLIESSPPVINKEFRFLLDTKKKFKVVAWYETLKERGYVKDNVGINVLVQLLNAKIEGLKLGKDGRIFRGKYRAYDFEDFKRNLISKIPQIVSS